MKILWGRPRDIGDHLVVRMGLLRCISMIPLVALASALISPAVERKEKVRMKQDNFQFASAQLTIMSS